MTTATIPAQDFSLERLERLLSTQKPVFWRHDVDFDPDCALKMALFEQRLGVESTYYVMARSEFYNPFAPQTRRTFLRIVNAGHTLGLHVDLDLPRTATVSTQTMVEACVEDRALLSRVLPVTDRVSFHAPPRDVYWRDVPGFDHALAAEWDGRHLADSRGVWQASPEKFIKKVDKPQLNLHAEWYWWPETFAQIRRLEEAVKP